MNKPDSRSTTTKAIECLLVGAAPEGQAGHALTRARELTREHGAQVRVVTAVPVPPFLWPGLEEGELDRIHSSALAGAKRAVINGYKDQWPIEDQAKPDNGLLVTAGNPAEVLLKQSDEPGIDLILLGAHRHRALLDFGSTGRSVLARSQVPVWVQAEEVHAVKTILVATDFSEHSIKAVHFARALALQFGAQLRVMSSYSLPAFAAAAGPDSGAMPGYVIEAERGAAKQQLDSLMDSVDWAGLDVQSVFAEGEAVGSILREAERSDLVVMGTHGRTGLARFLLGSVAYSVLKRSPRPVVVVPDGDRDWQVN